MRSLIAVNSWREKKRKEANFWCQTAHIYVLRQGVTNYCLEFIKATAGFHLERAKTIYFFFLHSYFVDTQYTKAVTAVSTSHVARSHPANRECEKHTEKYVHGGTYFLTCHHDGRLLFEIFSELLLRYPAN